MKEFLAQNLYLNALLVLAFVFLFFLIIREFVTWYWKLNKIVHLLEKIEKNTRSAGSSVENDLGE